MLMRNVAHGRCGRGTAGRVGLAALLGAAASLAVGCTDNKSATDLNPDGPPMVRQVFVEEDVQVGDPANNTFQPRLQLAFGDHPDIPTIAEDPTSGDDRKVDNAVVHAVRTPRADTKGAKIRIVLDELLLGSKIEEIGCDDGATWSKIPDDATPDDVAACTGEDLSKCKDICIGPDGPIGVLDADGDGAGDVFEMISYGPGKLGVTLTCDGQNIPLSQTLSFYNPSGNQLLPAITDPDQRVRGLGPALVLFPATDDITVGGVNVGKKSGLPAGSTCSIAFNDNIVDKDGHRICAPENGDINAPCTEGDTSKISFSVEPLFPTTDGHSPSLKAIADAIGMPLDGNDNVAITNSGTDFVAYLTFNANLDPDVLDSAITLSTGGTAVAGVTLSNVDNPTSIALTVPGGLTADTAYTLDISTDLTDVWGEALPEAISVSFTTAPAAPPAP